MGNGGGRHTCLSPSTSSMETVKDDSSLSREVLAHLKEWGVDQVTELQGKAENVVFARPKALA